jgi:hypothetical protein
VAITVNCVPRCAFHVLDLRTHAVRRFRRPRARGAVMPSIWGSRIVFARRAGGRWRVLTGRLGARGVRDISPPVQRLPVQTPRPVDTEMTADRAWFVWSSRVSGEACPTAAATPGDAMRSALRAAGPRGPSRLVDAGCDFQRIEGFSAPLVNDADSVTASALLGSGAGHVARRYAPAGVEEAFLPADVIRAAVPARVPYFDRRGSLIEGDPLDFAPAAPQTAGRSS